MANDIIKRPIRSVVDRMRDFPRDIIHPSVFTPEFTPIPGNVSKLLDMLVKAVDSYEEGYDFRHDISKIPSDSPYTIVKNDVIKMAVASKKEISNLYKNLIVKGVPTSVILKKFNFNPPLLATTKWDAFHKKLEKFESQIKEWDGKESPKKYLERMFDMEEKATGFIQTAVDARDTVYGKLQLLLVLAPFLNKNIFEEKKKMLEEALNRLDELGESADNNRSMIRQTLLIDGTIYDASGTLEPKTTLEDEINVFRFTKKPQGMFAGDETKPTHFGVAFGSLDEETVQERVLKQFPGATDIKVYSEFELNWDRYFSAWVDLVTFKASGKTTEENKKENKSLDEFI